MFILIILLLSILTIASAIILMASLVSKKSNLDREKTSPFECGFDPFSNSRIPFSLRFFMTTIIFLIFDVEIAIILPLPLSFLLLTPPTWMSLTSIFILTLFFGLLHEWNYGSLDWAA